MPYRLNSKQLFLTYPQCSLPKDEAYNFLEEFLKANGIEKILVAKELHANGDPHLHCYIKLEKAVDKRASNWCDLKKGDNIWHGNYQGCRSAANVLKYCTKKDDYVANFDVNEILKARNNVNKIIAEELINKKRPLIEVIEEYPIMLFQYKKLKENVECYFRDKEDERTTLPLCLPNPWGRVLWARKKGKRRHYWIFSRRPNLGKTYLFAKPLGEDFRIYIKTGDFTYWNLRGDEEGIILDEYNTAMLKYNYLNSMCDGSCEFRVFMGGVKALKDPLIIVLSNQAIYELYPNMNVLLYERFMEIELL